MPPSAATAAGSATRLTIRRRGRSPYSTKAESGDLAAQIPELSADTLVGQATLAVECVPRRDGDDERDGEAA